jgi:hypothetical protein
MNLHAVLKKEGPQEIIQKTDEKGAKYAKNNAFYRAGAENYTQAERNPNNRASEHRNERTEKKNHGKKQGSVYFENRKNYEGGASLIKRDKEKAHKKVLRHVREFGKQLARVLGVYRDCLDKKVCEI